MEGEHPEISGGRLLSTAGKEDLWSVGFRFPPLVETALDNILLNQKYGILPTAICPVRFLKQRKSETPEEKLVEATNRMNVQTNPGRGKSPRSSDGSTPQPKPKVALASKTPEADRMDS